MTSPLVSACVFDAYGTLLDLHSAIAAETERLGAQAGPLLNLWRRKQLEYTWLRTLMGRHADFASVTRDALAYTLESLQLPDEALARRLLDSFRHLTAFPEARPMLARLRAAGVRTAILSNGDPDMLHSALATSRLADAVDLVVSVQPLAQYKPAPPVYGLAAEALGLAADRLVFVSGNAWDAAGAASAGLSAILLDPIGAPAERLPGTPAATIRSLAELPALLGVA
jgi:2-haloacid dehalogenase